ncbi:nucleotidyl transferase AbiEii/AbiGii toxin family protein [Dasania sp. GY-MA-18]|uniref:Nucleotidyl transferase AbiEii/AbiGii toxin family protein n=1 Tax=Dasania phycosphaerae TaxID=2950436 RepID=A0A9J6RNP5_9GAMM|nr:MULTISPECIES: nucleotidyl transferase AbiEii/AbiGii toxin family protein [Dasania]MCR8923197.1 nucleotidyl transferase AbiEii/AbiGii toxin family protein [Dasania sp. GY-MA-18]MCZ0865629.1 nucleotidyl transferase AbiEii/AbiGii toxin family protein [Dasania phycosphaerae]MCZ0869354.1 nucleotidyl transferase AbiEii/AbiGii toxin family protein [Dasania phycosphaerae]
MSSTLLNISGKIDTKAVALYAIVSEVTAQLAMPFVVVGASARDVVLHYGHGANMQRATEDIDFGIQVPDWSAFKIVKKRLLAKGFNAAREEHRLISPDNMQVDIVPFGKIEDEHANIAWPPEGGWVMNVLGFQEVCDHAETVRIQNSPIVDIPVATPQGMALLKLIAWLDREADMRIKDAKDFLYLLTNYEIIPSVKNSLYESPALMEHYEWDLSLAAAHQLGINARGLAKEPTANTITKLFNGGHDKLTLEQLISEMGGRSDDQYTNNEVLTNAFIKGFLQSKK